uniref:Uncharacterized protein n=1 Tax=Anopheles atroparvus TaxID=41427 RepID=A0A182J4H8_ANOAO
MLLLLLLLLLMLLLLLLLLLLLDCNTVDEFLLLYRLYNLHLLLLTGGRCCRCLQSGLIERHDLSTGRGRNSRLALLLHGGQLYLAMGRGGRNQLARRRPAGLLQQLRGRSEDDFILRRLSRGRLRQHVRFTVVLLGRNDLLAPNRYNVAAAAARQLLHLLVRQDDRRVVVLHDVAVAGCQSRTVGATLLMLRLGRGHDDRSRYGHDGVRTATGRQHDARLLRNRGTVVVADGLKRSGRGGRYRDDDRRRG